MEISLKNSVYDMLKFVAQIVIPAAATLYSALAAIWHLPYAEQIPTSLIAFDTFLGAILCLSSAHYIKKGGEQSGL